MIHCAQAEAAQLAVRLDPELPVAQPRLAAGGGFRAAWSARDGASHWVRCYDLLPGVHHQPDAGPLVLFSPPFSRAVLPSTASSLSSSSRAICLSQFRAFLLPPSTSFSLSAPPNCCNLYHAHYNYTLMFDVHTRRAMRYFWRGEPLLLGLLAHFAVFTPRQQHGACYGTCSTQTCCGRC